MPRQLKLKEVKAYEHPSGVKIPILLDRETMEFVAKIAEGAEFREKVADELYAKVKEYLDNATKLDWRPVIEIQCHELSNFEFRRYYTAQTTDGTWRELDWEGYLERSIVKEGEDRGYSQEANTEMERLRISHHDYHDKNFSFAALPWFSEGAWNRTGEPDQAIIHYTSEKWAALEAIDNALELLKTRLREVLTSSKGLDHLQAAGAKAAQLLLK
jgi:hypothetical protein